MKNPDRLDSDEESEINSDEMSGHELWVICEDTPTHANDVPVNIRRRLSFKRVRVKRLIFNAKVDAEKVKQEYI